MKHTKDNDKKFEVIDDPDKIGVQPHLPMTQLNNELGLDKWAHRKKDLSVVRDGETVDPKIFEVTDEVINNIANQPGDVEPWD